MAYGTERYDRQNSTWVEYWFDYVPEIQAVEFDVDEDGRYTDLVFYYEGSNEPHAINSLEQDSTLRYALEVLLDG